MRGGAEAGERDYEEREDWDLEKKWGKEPIE